MDVRKSITHTLEDEDLWQQSMKSSG